MQQEAPDLLDEDSAKARQQKLSVSAEQLLETMETVLLWSKSQMERFVPEKKKVMISEMFVTLKKQVPENTGIEITFNDPENIRVETDEDYLGAILYNLHANAVKALKNTPDPKLEWKAFNENGHISICITDNGPGISKEQMEVLYNEDAVISGKQGLGLHIIRDIAKAIDCGINIESDESKGTTIILLF